MAEINPLLLHVGPRITPDLASGIQTFVIVLCLVMLLRLWYRQRAIWGRPAFFVLVFFMLLYQFPAVLLSEFLRQSLPNAEWFLIVVNIVPVSLLFWLYVSQRFIKNRTDESSSRPVVSSTGQPDAVSFISPAAILMMLFMMAALAGVYLHYVPWACTGLYAMLFDPMSMLTARELTIKLVGSPVAAIAYGTFANAIGPVFVFLLIGSVISFARKHSYGPAMAGSLALGAAIGFIMLPGIKGMLLPTFLVLIIALASLPQNWSSRIIVSGFASIMIFATLAGIDLVRERSTGLGKTVYDFGYCAKKLGACDAAKELIDSASLRVGSLGLHKVRVLLMKQQLHAACNFTGDFASEKNGRAPGSGVGSIGPSALPRVAEARFTYDEYLQAILSRAFVIPIQVGAWHYLYVAEHGPPGFAGLSLARRISNASINMPVEVYREYGVVYSGGDRTSTSTAPTSFLLAYPAYLGATGLLVSVLLVILFDLASAYLLVRAASTLRAVAAGVFAVASMNMMSSDYLTVMGSHGGAAGFVLIGLLIASQSRDFNVKRAFDLAVASMLLIVLLPVFIVIAAAVRLFLGSPVFFFQVRPGLHGRSFSMVKFRTMRDAVDSLGNPLPDELRLTAFGRFLRSTSLDELPELWNVIKGEMSLVGPRPLLMEYLPLYTDEQARRHEVRPGITGWAQINGRNALSWKDKFALDVWYVDNHSFWLDIKILLLTLKKVIRRDGINAEGEATVGRFTGSDT